MEFWDSNFQHDHDSEEEDVVNLANRLLVLEHDLSEILSDDEFEPQDLAFLESAWTRGVLVEEHHRNDVMSDEEIVFDHHPLNDLDLMLMEEDLERERLRDGGDFWLVDEDEYMPDGYGEEEQDSWTDYLVNQRYKQAVREDDEKECCVRAALCWMWVWGNSPALNIPREIAQMIGKMVLESKSSQGEWMRARKLRKALSLVRAAGFSVEA